jgi:hypothetical protein
VADHRQTGAHHRGQQDQSGELAHRHRPEPGAVARPGQADEQQAEPGPRQEPVADAGRVASGPLRAILPGGRGDQPDRGQGEDHPADRDG